MEENGTSPRPGDEEKLKKEEREKEGEGML